MEIRSVVPPNLARVPLIDYISARFTYLKRDEWLERILENRFTVDGEVATDKTILPPKSVLVYDMPDFIEPPADLNYKIVFENDHFLAVNKPGNLLVHKSGKSFRNNLIYQLRENHNPPYPNAHIVNRLDRETSGVVLVAKDKSSLKELNELFATRSIEKKYMAVVKGELTPQYGTVLKSIAKDKDSEISYKFKVDDDGKECQTYYRTVLSKNGLSLVELTPKTGRTHQLRVHLKSLGNPIYGDKIYGMSESDYLEWRKSPTDFEGLEFNRHCLHCLSLKFEFRGESFFIEAKVSAEIMNLIE
jgi:RluA family pseudouridine synthase